MVIFFSFITTGAQRLSNIRFVFYIDGKVALAKNITALPYYADPWKRFVTALRVPCSKTTATINLAMGAHAGNEIPSRLRLRNKHARLWIMHSSS